MKVLLPSLSILKIIHLFIVTINLLLLSIHIRPTSCLCRRHSMLMVVNSVSTGSIPTTATREHEISSLLILMIRGGKMSFDSNDSSSEGEEREMEWIISDQGHDKDGGERELETEEDEYDIISSEDISEGEKSYLSLSESSKDAMINTLILSKTNSEKGIIDAALNDMVKTKNERSKTNKKTKKSSLTSLRKYKKNLIIKWSKKKHKIPYIVRVMFSSKTIWKMTKVYWQSLFNIKFLEENALPEYKVSSSTVTVPLFPSTKTKTVEYCSRRKQMQPGQAKKLSDLPQLSN